MSEAIGRGKQIVVIYTDFSNAFDRMPYTYFFKSYLIWYHRYTLQLIKVFSR